MEKNIPEWPSLEKKYALITGASSGIGRDFARILAAKGINLVIVARREELLKQLKEELKELHQVEIEIFVKDLSEPNSALDVKKYLDQKGIFITLLINNAGFGLFGDFAKLDEQKEQQMLQLNINTLVQLTKIFLKEMLAKGEGYILQVASVTSFQPVPWYSTYGASKSFVLHFAEALYQELKGTPIHVSALCPGETATEFFARSNDSHHKSHSLGVMGSYEVATLGLEALFQRKPFKITGFHNAFAAFLSRLFPRSWVAAIAFFIMKNR